jgi:hypothetical protein
MKLDFASPPRPILEVNFHHFCTFSIVITPWKFLVCSRSVYQIAVRATGEFRAAYRFPKVSLARDSVDCEETRFATGHSFGGVEFAAEFALNATLAYSRVIRAFMSPQTEGQSRDSCAWGL